MLFPSVNRQKSWLLFLLILAIVLHLYFNFSFHGSVLERGRWLDGVFARVFIPIQTGFVVSQDFLSESASAMTELWKAHRENEELRKRVDEQAQLLQAMEDLRHENNRLRALLDYRQSQAHEFVTARVISRDISPFFRAIEIDAGADQGLEKLMGVVAPQGVVGRVIAVHSSSSTVLLINDLNSRLDAVVERSRTSVIVGGSPEGGLNLRYLPRRRDVKQGDLLVTSGLNNDFPPGLKIGVILGIAEDPHFVLEEAELEPFADLQSIEEVFVVRSIRKGKGS